MKNKTIVLLLLSFLLLANVYAFADDSETVVIDSVTLTESADNELIEVDVSYTATSGVDEITLFMTVADSDGEGQFEDAVYINQVPNEGGKYQFPIEKAKIAEVAGNDVIEGMLLSVKMGGTSVSTPSVMTVTYGTSGESGDGVVLGDANGDGSVDFADAILVLKHDAGISALNGNNLTVADANGNGTVDFADAILILKYDAGLIKDFN